MLDKRKFEEDRPDSDSYQEIIKTGEN